MIIFYKSLLVFYLFIFFFFVFTAFDIALKILKIFFDLPKKMKANLSRIEEKSFWRKLKNISSTSNRSQNIRQNVISEKSKSFSHFFDFRQIF